MINGFSKVVQDDVTLIGNAFADKVPKTAENERRITLAVARVFAAFGMVSSAILGLSALSMGAGVFSIVLSGFGFAIYHDVFVISRNADLPFASKLFLFGKGVVSDVQDLWIGNKTAKSAPRHAHTEGTFFRPAWDALLAIR